MTARSQFPPSCSSPELKPFADAYTQLMRDGNFYHRIVSILENNTDVEDTEYELELFYKDSGEQLNTTDMEKILPFALCRLTWAAEQYKNVWEARAIEYFRDASPHKYCNELTRIVQFADKNWPRHSRTETQQLLVESIRHFFDIRAAQYSAAMNAVQANRPSEN